MTDVLRIRTLALLLPGDVEGTVAERRERRYLVSEAEATGIATRLKGNEAERPQYRVTTTYLRYLDGTPYRLRQYDGGSDFKLECKRRTSGRNLKATFAVTDQIRKAGYEASVTYERSAYEINGTRVTVDRDVQTLGKRLGQVVVEVKGPTIPPAIASLLPPEDPTFGKRQWATA